MARGGQRKNQRRAVGAPRTQDQPGPDLVTVAQAELRQHSGPLPDPETLERYEAILPGAADRAFRMAENQSQHRIRLETFAIESESKRASRGQLFALIIGVVGLLVSGGVAVAGREGAAIAIAGFDIVGLASVFITGSIIRRNERTEKAKIMRG